MNMYSRYNPLVLIVYFFSVVLVTMFTVNPVILGLSLFASITCYSLLADRKELIFNIAFYALMFLLIVITNPLFNQNGETVLFVMFGFNVTMEAVLYGCAVGVMIIDVIFWFKCYNHIVTDDKFMYVFGSIIPKLSLVISMSLRFVTLFKQQAVNISETQKTLGLYSGEKLKDRLSGGMRVFMSVLSWSLENSIDTSSSMKARGYGAGRRTNFSMYKFSLRDAVMLAAILAELAVTAVCAVKDGFAFAYYPRMNSISMSGISGIGYIAVLMLMFGPLVIEFAESIKWKLLVSKI